MEGIEQELRAEIERLKACNAALMKDSGKSTLAIEVQASGEGRMRVVVTDPTGDRVREMEAAVRTVQLLQEVWKDISLTEAAFTPAVSGD